MDCCMGIIINARKRRRRRKLNEYEVGHKSNRICAATSRVTVPKNSSGGIECEDDADLFFF